MINFKKTLSLLRRSRRTEAKIEQYLDKVTISQLLFNKLWDDFFEHGPRNELTLRTLEKLNNNESEADGLRRTIEALLFEKTLIPDLRADVMTLLEYLEDILDLHEAIGFHIKIEQPKLTKEYRPLLNILLEKVTLSIDHMILCVRSFFNDLERVHEYNQKTIFYESEADEACTNLKMQIFDSDMPLEEKVQIRYFIDKIDQLANRAEDTVDRIAIYTLKRAI